MLLKEYKDINSESVSPRIFITNVNKNLNTNEEDIDNDMLIGSGYGKASLVGGNGQKSYVKPLKATGKMTFFEGENSSKTNDDGGTIEHVIEVPKRVVAAVESDLPNVTSKIIHSILPQLIQQPLQDNVNEDN